MSCKVISGDRLGEARPLFGGAVRERVPSEPDQVRIAAVPEAMPAAQAAEMHNRIVELERSLQRGVQQAREDGWREGEAAGRERAAAEVKPVMERLTRSIGEMASLRSRIRRETEADLISLSVAIARRILRRELTVDPEAVQGLVRAALEKVQARDICRVRTHVSQAAPIRKQLESAGGSGTVEIVGDTALQPGDVIIETARGDLDASVDTQLNEIERGFADRLGR